MYADWLADNDQYVKAIDMWKLVLKQNPSNVEAIEYEINKLTEKLQ